MEDPKIVFAWAMGGWGGEGVSKNRDRVSFKCGEYPEIGYSDGPVLNILKPLGYTLSMGRSHGL